MIMDKKIVTITGISCSGKSFLASYANNNDSGFKEAVSTTTRPRRTGEVHGREYYFVSKEEFESLSNKNQLLERNLFADNFYGLSIKGLNDVYEKNLVPIVVIDPNGARNLRIRGNELGIQVYNIYINCSVKLSIQRWLERSKLDSESGNPNVDYYASRIEKTLTDESLWSTALDYHLVLDNSTNEDELKNQIKNISDFISRPIEYKNPKNQIARHKKSTRLYEQIASKITGPCSFEDILSLYQQNQPQSLTSNPGPSL